MKHTKWMIAPAALVAALACGAWPQASASRHRPMPPPSPSRTRRSCRRNSMRHARSSTSPRAKSPSCRCNWAARAGVNSSSRVGQEGLVDLVARRRAPSSECRLQMAPVRAEPRCWRSARAAAAADAGIKTGDIITSIGGEDISKESDPGRALVARMAQIDPNLKVQVGVLRDGKKMNFDVTPRPAPAQAFRLERRGPGGPGGPPGAQVFTFPGPGAGPGMPGLPGMAGPREERRIIINRGDDGGAGMRFFGIEFATLTEKLGSYFGVKSGVLVVRAGSNPAFKLQDGDVILAIDGRTPTNAQHAGRILRSYSRGEKLVIRVQRDRKAQNLEVTVPGGSED